MTRRQQTALFIAIALAGSYAIGAVWLAHPDWGWLSQFLMWTPGVAALVLLALRREPPRTLGFAIGRPLPWLIAFAFPFLVIATCIVLAYAIAAVTGADIIHLQPQAVHRTTFGRPNTGFDIIPLWLARNLWLIGSWLLLALAYQFRIPERLGPARHLLRAALWCGVYWVSTGWWWVPPGTIGEELGWRGWLVRTWRDRPITALALSACTWAAFHVPVIVLEPPLHSVIPALSFLLSIAAAAAVFQALYLASGSIWPPAIAHLTWNMWNPLFLGSQYGGPPSLFGGELWLINGEGVLGMLVNGALTLVLVRRWLRRRAAQAPRSEIAGPALPLRPVDPPATSPHSHPSVL